MFSTNHFIWLGLCALFIGGLLYSSLRFKLSFKIATYIVSGICIASELCKIFTHIDEIYEGDTLAVFSARSIFPSISALS